MLVIDKESDIDKDYKVAAAIYTLAESKTTDIAIDSDNKVTSSS